MFKLNNKGFAFSTILYGLMLMGIMIVIIIMSLMQTNRVNNKRFVENIEKELNRYSLTETVFDSNGIDSGQEYIIPTGQSGWYKIELWGAQGGNNGGLGAYTSGLIWLRENTHLYFYVGKQNNTLNGAGNGTNKGGGATDVRLYDGSWSSNLDKRIMVAAGGGGGNQGGAGGTILGFNGTGTGAGTGGNQNAGTFGTGQNGSGSGSGGGGGFYTGQGSTNTGGAGGGSSYISGYAGVYSRNRTGENITKYNASAEELYYTPGYFINGIMLPGVNYGEGSAKITKVLATTATDNGATKPARLNTRLNSVRYVKDCIYGSRTANTGTVNNNYWSELQVIVDGKNIAYGKPFSFNGPGGGFSSGTANSKLTDSQVTLTKDGVTENNKNDRCVIVDLGGTYAPSEIAVWHDYVTANQNAINHRLFVSNNNSSWVEIASSVANSLETYETSNGLRYSAFTPGSMDTLQDGTYYIKSVASTNLFLTTSAVTDTVPEPSVSYKKFTGAATQQWNIKSIGGGKYLITSVEGGVPLQVKNGTYYDGSALCVKRTDGAYSWEQWYISHAGRDSAGNTVVAGGNTFYIYANVIINPVDAAGNPLPSVNGNIYLGANYNASAFFNADSSTAVGKTFVANSTDVTNSVKNRLMRFKIIPVSY